MKEVLDPRDFKSEKELSMISLLKKFSNYEFVNEKYIEKLIRVNKINDDIYNKVKELIYKELCSKAIEDEEILLQLQIDLERITRLIFKKLKITDTTKFNDAIEEYILYYDGEDFERGLTKRIMGISHKRLIPEKSDKKLAYKIK